LAERRIVVAVAVVLVAGAAVGGWAAWHYWLYAPPPPGAAVIFRVRPGASAGEIAADLKRAGLVRHARAFAREVRKRGLTQRLRAGYYQFTRGMSVRELADKIAAGDTLKQTFTVPEGYTVRKIARRLGERKIATRERFIAAASDARLAREVGLTLPAGASCEGYLFPETYVVEYATPEDELVRIMLREFQRRTDPLAKEMAASRLGPRGIIILASMIEGEAMLDDERPVIAGVYYNRLRRGMRLECDATIVYAWALAGETKTRLLFRDLEIDSPYNTYKHDGLPTGPICNPGMASIQAALQPDHNDYLYYVARGDGSHIFTRTHAEHLAAIRSVRAARSRS
jgi:UPF0755 protein